MLRFLALGPFAAVVLVTTACGAGPAPSEDVASSAALAGNADSARVVIVSRHSLGDGTEAHEFRQTGVVDYRNDRSVYVDEPSGCRTITIGANSYSERPSDQGLLPVGKRWVESGGMDDSEALFEQSREQTQSEDGIIIWRTVVGISISEPAPSEYLEYLREMAEEPELVGRERVRGVSTTRYRAELDLQRITRAELEAAGWKATNIERYLEDQLEQDQTVEIWVDAEGLVRRVVSTNTGAEAGIHFRTETTTEYFAFGVATDIQPPPAAEVVGAEEWQSYTEEHLRAWVDENEEGISPFEQEVSPAPDSCLH